MDGALVVQGRIQVGFDDHLLLQAGIVVLQRLLEVVMDQPLLDSRQRPKELCVVVGDQERAGRMRRRIEVGKGASPTN
ncbi:MAG: hypothetical protein RJA36_710 [Pseudomonadota bacterium]|jgi:hypothetical protein